MSLGKRLARIEQLLDQGWETDSAIFDVCMAYGGIADWPGEAVVRRVAESKPTGADGMLAAPAREAARAYLSGEWQQPVIPNYEVQV